MGTGAITGYVDVAQIVLYLFWAFFAGLIIYLVRENKREGYPLETDNGPIDGWPPRPRPKTYLLEGGKSVDIPNDFVSPQKLQAEPIHGWLGAPIEPTGNPLLIDLDASLKPVTVRYLDAARAKPLPALP